MSCTRFRLCFLTCEAFTSRRDACHLLGELQDLAAPYAERLLQARGRRNVLGAMSLSHFEAF